MGGGGVCAHVECVHRSRPERMRFVLIEVQVDVRQ